MVDAPVFANIPFYEPVIFGNPLYIWIILFMGAIMLLAAVAFKLEIYDRLEPVWGHRTASFRNIPEAILLGMSGKIWLMPLDSIAGIFSAMGLPLRWIQTLPTQGQLGKVNVVIVQDDWNIVHNVDVDYAIVEVSHRWNEAWAKDHKLGDAGFIYNWESFYDHYKQGHFDQLYPNGIVPLPPVRYVDLRDVKRYLPEWSASAHSGYINAELEKRKPEKDDERGLTLVKYAIIAGGILLICAVLAWFILRL